MRILQINSVCGIRSTGRIVTDLYQELVKEGHECCIAYGREQAPEKVNTYRINTKLDVMCHAGLSRITDRQGFYSTNATKRLVKWMKCYNPDIIHLHNIHGYYLNIIVLFHALKEMKKPIIWTLHDCWAFTGHCSQFDYIDCNRWEKGCYSCPQKKAYPTSLFLDKSKLNYCQKKECLDNISSLTFVTPSYWLADLVRKSFANSYPVEVIPNGVDIEVFKKEKSDFRKRYDLEDKFVLLGVSSFWGERKGYSIFLQLADMLDEKSKIVLVGVTKQQKEKLPDKIIGIEKTNNTKELAQIYSAADVFINPTLEDNYPTVNLEAQLCGLPVITFQSGGSGESICPNGVVLNEKSSAAIMNNLEKNRKLEEIDRYQFSKELMMKRYIECYLKSLQKK